MLGPWIRRMRQARAWSQRELGERAGVGMATISALERERTTQPQRAVLAVIAGAFGMPLDRMLRDAGVPTAGSCAPTATAEPKQLAQDLVDLWPHLSAAERATVRALHEVLCLRYGSDPSRAG